MWVVPPPGGYGDGPVYVRVDKELAGDAWPVRHCGFSPEGEQEDQRCRDDTAHVYVRAANSHSAFVYHHWMRQAGVPASALAVVRLSKA